MEILTIFLFILAWFFGCAAETDGNLEMKGSWTYYLSIMFVVSGVISSTYSMDIKSKQRIDPVVEISCEGDDVELECDTIYLYKRY